MARISILTGLATIGLLATNLLTVKPAQASAVRFFCGTASGIPTTQAQTGNGRSVNVIRWTSNSFDGAGWTPQRRCQEVSQRFEEFHQQRRLNYLTTGRMNGQPVICTARENGGACDGLLYTLKPGQDATTTLKNLLEVRVKARGPLNETSARLYISIDELVGNGAAVTPATTQPASTSNTKGQDAIW